MLIAGILLAIVTWGVIISCGGGSSVGGLNNILVGNTGGSGGTGGSGSANITPLAFDDLSNNSTATFIDANSDFDDTDDGLYLDSGILPFNFSLFGNNFSSGSDVVFCTNGWLSFDSDIDSDDFDSYDPADNIDDVLVGDSDGPYDSFIAPFWSDLVMDAYSNQGVWYETIGSSPNRKFVVQYYASDIENYDNILVFQVVLFEGTNDIQFTYAKMEDVNGDDSFQDDGAVDGSGSFIGLLSGDSSIDNARYSIYSFLFPSIPAISTQAYYIYFKYNSSTNNYDIYTGNVDITDLNNSYYGANVLANRRQNINKNKVHTNHNFTYFYKNNTPQELMNFINTIKTNKNK